MVTAISAATGGPPGLPSARVQAVEPQSGGGRHGRVVLQQVRIGQRQRLGAGLPGCRIGATTFARRASLAKLAAVATPAGFAAEPAGVN